MKYYTAYYPFVLLREQYLPWVPITCFTVTGNQTHNHGVLSISCKLILAFASGISAWFCDQLSVHQTVKWDQGLSEFFLLWDSNPGPLSKRLCGVQHKVQYLNQCAAIIPPFEKRKGDKRPSSPHTIPCSCLPAAGSQEWATNPSICYISEFSRHLNILTY